MVVALTVDGPVLNGEQARAAVFEIRVNRPGSLNALEVRLDDRDMTAEVARDEGVRLEPGALEDGDHR